MVRCFMMSLRYAIMAEGASSGSRARRRLSRPLQFEHLGVEHQINGFLGCDYNGLLTAFPKMDIRSAHELSMIKEALFLSERESVFPDPASPSHTARRRPPPAGGDTAPISRRC